MKIVGLLCLLAMTSLVTCRIGAEVSQLLTTDTYKCLKNNNISFIFPRGYIPTGLDPNIIQNLKNIRSAGYQQIDTSVYFIPCRGKDAGEQVTKFMQNVNYGSYWNIYFLIENSPSPGCAWSGYTSSTNCEYLMNLAQEVRFSFKQPAVSSSKNSWASIFGSESACQGAMYDSLWYINYDNKASFSDFTPFGGWKNPAYKSYLKGFEICGTTVNLVYSN